MCSKAQEVEQKQTMIEDNKVRKITIEFDDYIDVLEKEDAKAWYEMLQKLTIVGWSHGIDMGPFNWERTKKSAEQQAK